jgi:hypothetical protein
LKSLNAPTSDWFSVIMHTNYKAKGGGGLLNL